MDRSKIVAVITGAIALVLGIAYLTVVQLLDFRGEMIPAPIEIMLLPQGVEISQVIPDFQLPPQWIG